LQNFLVKRLLQLIPLLIGITLISFFVIHLAPGDPTNLFTDPSVKPEELARIKANWGLDKPIYVQYFYWVKNAARGDFGNDLLTGRPVVDEIMERMPATLLLMGSAMFLIFLIAIPLGVLSAVKKGTWFDQTITVLTFVGMATPAFWLALMLMLVFSVTLGWLPALGMASSSAMGRFDSSIDLLKHLILPVLTMALVGLAGLTRYQRSAMLEVLKEDYIRTARAKGLPERTVIFKHALRNALIPIITIFGLSLPDLFGGAFIIETVFAWPGMGRFGVQAVFQRNYPVLMAMIVLSAVLIVIGNLIADLLYAWADPRQRTKAEPKNNDQ
jgi:peptide/nickel transport system permease protein